MVWCAICVPYTCVANVDESPLPDIPIPALPDRVVVSAVMSEGMMSEGIYFTKRLRVPDTFPQSRPYSPCVDGVDNAASSRDNQYTSC